MTSLHLSKIEIGASTQTRAGIDESIVADYCERWLEGDKFPPVVVFHDGSDYFLADGFHRFHAASKAGFRDIQADVRKGTRTDALVYSLGANITHGLKRTNADKRHCVTVALREFADWSDRKVAETCGVSQPFVGQVRSQLLTVNSSSEPVAPQHRTGKDGKKRAVKKVTKSRATADPDAWKKAGGTIAPIHVAIEESPEDKYPENVRGLLGYWIKATKPERAMFCELGLGEIQAIIEKIIRERPGTDVGEGGVE